MSNKEKRMKKEHYRFGSLQIMYFSSLLLALVQPHWLTGHKTPVYLLTTSTLQKWGWIFWRLRVTACPRGGGVTKWSHMQSCLALWNTFVYVRLHIPCQWPPECSPTQRCSNNNIHEYTDSNMLLSLLSLGTLNIRSCSSSTGSTENRSIWDQTHMFLSDIVSV